MCEVEIDADTGVVEIVRYTSVDDAGQVINPLVVHGQTHGGIVQGAGQALSEAVVHDPDSGQVLSASFMDYADAARRPDAELQCRNGGRPDRQQQAASEGRRRGGHHTGAGDHHECCRRCVVGLWHHHFLKCRLRPRASGQRSRKRAKWAQGVSRDAPKAFRKGETRCSTRRAADFTGWFGKMLAAQAFAVKREVFVSPEVLEGENRKLFDTLWVYVGHDSGAAKPGDFKTRWVAGRPIIFVRGQDGVVRALINSCRHRGAMVCRERDGNARQFFCIRITAGPIIPTAQLKGVPGEDGYPPSFDKSVMGLAEVPRLEQYRDFYFLNFDRDAVDLKTYLGKQPTISISLPTSRRPARWKSFPARRNTISRRTGSCWSRTASTTITCWRRIRRGSTTCAIPASTCIRRKILVCCCRRERRQGPRQRASDDRQPEFSRPAVARWISVYGEEAKADIDAIRAELVTRLEKPALHMSPIPTAIW